jgi:hypothetical protein
MPEAAMSPTASPIAVLLDGSTRDESVLRTALRLFHTLSVPSQTVETVLLRVIPPAPLRRVADSAPLVDLAERQAYRDLWASARGLSLRRVRCTVLVGAAPAQEVLRWLLDHPVAAIVVSRPERRGWRRRGDQLVQSLLRWSPAPVVVATPSLTAWPPPTHVLDLDAVFGEIERILHAG